MPLAAQVDHASLNGTVTDSSGALIGGAKVEAVSSATGFRRQSVTSSAGTYEIPGLAIGAYTVTISKDGFKSAEFKDVELAVGQPRTLDARLEVGSITEAVEVTATVETLNRTSAEVGGMVEAEQIKEIPVSGRNWASLMLLAPGAINYGDGAQRAIRFNGHSLDDSNFIFDGIDTSGVQEQTQKADARLNIALDSIAEFRVSTSDYTAEAGAAGGAQVSVVSKSGTNDYHGSTFYAVRNEPWMRARRSTARRLPAFHPEPVRRQLRRRHREGQGVLLCQLRRLAPEPRPDVLSNLVPNAAFRAQVLGHIAGARAAAERLSGREQRPIDSITDQVTDVATDTVREDAGMFRFDYRFNDRNTAYARYNIDNAYIDNPSDALGDHSVIPHIPTNVVLQFQHIFSPTTVDEAKFGINRANYHNWGYGTAPVSLSVSA